MKMIPQERKKLIDNLSKEEIWELEKRAQKLFCFTTQDYITKRHLIYLIKNLK